VNTINELKSVNKISEVNIDVEKSLVTLITNETTLGIVREKLSKLGYPEVGDKNTILHKEKSFVSCAVGRVNKA